MTKQELIDFMGNLTGSQQRKYDLLIYNNVAKGHVLYFDYLEDIIPLTRVQRQLHCLRDVWHNRSALPREQSRIQYFILRRIQ